MTKQDAVMEQFEKAIARLEEVLQEPKSSIVRDSAIKRFELSFDLCWKTLKEVLLSVYGVECASPKKCFREAYKQGLIRFDNFWIELTDLRNETAHTYKEVFAEEVFHKLPNVLTHFRELLETLHVTKE